MARIHREASFRGEFDVSFESAWRGYGWAEIPLEWIHFNWMASRNQGEPIGWIVEIGKLRLHVLEVRNWEVHVVQENWRWPFWWLTLRAWLALCWFERNLRMTAAIWGLLHRPEPGCMPFWSDFIVLQLLRKRKARGPAC